MSLLAVFVKIGLIIKLASVVVGAFLVLLSLSYFANEFGYLGQTGFPGLRDIFLIIAILGTFLSGVALIAELPNSTRIRFRRLPHFTKPKEVYGFATIFAIGLGSTLGSPLFVLIPLNITEYQIASIGSMILATVLSILMARIYSSSYRILHRNNLDSVGGPSFLKAAAGKRSLRYFVSRVSMSVANIALSAYCAIIFVLFDFQFMPGLLSSYGITGLASGMIVALVIALFVSWFILNALFESRLIKIIGRVQILLTTVMVVILVYHSFLLGSAGSWNFSGLFSTLNLPGGNLPYALLINTAYLYLLFFGFQEIQAIEREAKEDSKIPVISWIKRGFTLPKTKYFQVAMISSVVVASIVNIFYGLAVYTVRPNLQLLSSAQIPALYLAQEVLGLRAETLMALAFLIATFTTIVPAFLAASRHISSLAQDGFIPQSISRVSWVFVLVAIGILSVAGQTFLVSITDFMVLVSLALISFSAIWLRRSRKSAIEKDDTVPLIGGISCIVASIAVYLFSPSVAVFGSLSIVVAYLLFDVFELGSLGVELFLCMFNAVMYILVTMYPHGFISQYFVLFSLLHIPPLTTEALSDMLLVAILLLLINFVVNVQLQRRSRKSYEVSKTSRIENR